MFKEEIKKLKENLQLEMQKNEKNNKMIVNFRMDIEVNREVQVLIEEKKILMHEKEEIAQEYQKLIRKTRSDNDFDLLFTKNTIIMLEERINQLDNLKHP